MIFTENDEDQMLLVDGLYLVSSKLKEFVLVEVLCGSPFISGFDVSEIDFSNCSYVRLKSYE